MPKRLIREMRKSHPQSALLMHLQKGFGLRSLSHLLGKAFKSNLALDLARFFHTSHVVGETTCIKKALPTTKPKERSFHTHPVYDLKNDRALGLALCV